MDFENDKQSRGQLIYYYRCGVDDDGLDAGSGSKNDKTRKSSQSQDILRPNFIDINRPTFTAYFRFDTFWNVPYGENTPPNTLGSNIEVNGLKQFRTSHHTSVPVPYRSVQYRTVPYRRFQVATVCKTKLHIIGTFGSILFGTYGTVKIRLLILWG